MISYTCSKCNTVTEVDDLGEVDDKHRRIQSLNINTPWTKILLCPSCAAEFDNIAQQNKQNNVTITEHVTSLNTWLES